MGGPGGSWGGLGRSWGDLGVTFLPKWFPINFLNDFGAEKGRQRDAFWETKSDQNGDKIGVEI